MSCSLKTVDGLQLLEDLSTEDCNRNCILKSKENIFKPKCRKSLKKKLKKYKVRKDGTEDPDILDVSKILISSLKIKSPSNQKIQNIIPLIEESENLTPCNHLFKMVKGKKSSLNNAKVNSSPRKVTKETEDIFPLVADTDQDVKQMDAFKLMMEGRNKSLGSNSPGKEKCLQESDIQEVIMKKELKAKRMLSLEKLAERKGSLKKKEIEEFREKCVRKKMLKRAEKLKSMISNNKKGNEKPYPVKTESEPLQKCITIEINDNDVSEHKSSTEQNGTFRLFDCLSESATTLNKCQLKNKHIAKDDDEFLNKLSPSLRKKENMYSYFKKIPKSNISPEEENKSESIIKVKMTPKKKKKTKKSDISDDVSNKLEKEENNTLLDVNKQGHKRKRKVKKELDDTACLQKVSGTNGNEQMEVSGTNETNGNERPKRNIKKPAKYIENIELSSSDEELHIFTPKKKRNTQNKLGNKIENEIEQSPEPKVLLIIKEDKDDKKTEHSLKIKIKNKNKILKRDAIEKQNQNKSIKLAPIFVSKSQLSALEVEAKQKFLRSGFPDKLNLKLQIEKISCSTNTFNSVVHIQQHQDLIKNEIPVKNWYRCSSIETNENCNNIDLHLFQKLLQSPSVSNLNIFHLKQKPDKLLKSIKAVYSKFPVYRTYHLLKSKSQGELTEYNFQELDSSVEIVNEITEVNNENPERLSWNDKYKPMSSKQIIGNFESIKEMKRWLESWTENVKSKSSYNKESDLSDFCCSDSDDSKDTFKQTNNILIVTGPVGTGKTSSVYAVAAELAIKVIEVNSSSKRTGKIMLQDLKEATKSHKVNRGPNKIENSQKSQEDVFINSKKRGRPKKTYERRKKGQTDNIEKEKKETPKEVIQKEVMSRESQQSSQNSQEVSRTAMSLILIDDADVVFDQDDGFCSAISQLIQCSKRPVILITSSLTCPHLQRFLSCAKIIHMNPLLPRMLGTWLDIMCLADTSSCYPGFGMKVLDYYKGDIRKAINFLHFFMTSEKYLQQIEDQTLAQVTNIYKRNIDDENSSMSWSDEVTENTVKETVDKNDLTIYVDQQLASPHFDAYRNLFDIWWSFKNVFYEPSHIELNTEKNSKCKEIAQILNNLSFIDTLSKHNKGDLSSRPWCSTELESVNESEDFFTYDRNYEVATEISNELIRTAMSIPRHIIWDSSMIVHPATMAMQRERNELVSRHTTLTSHLNPSAALDRRALALDYWPLCRTICRLEKNKNDSNIKRNNRFCHYLKSLNVLCKNEFFDNLSESLS